ncbi:MAG: DUF3592 domain-containing protein [Bacilli bacterium]|nr:DUF3592 domain-containing protein [Bacilli bacterium]
METFIYIGLIGLAFLAIGIIKAIIYDFKVKNYTKTEGTVTSYMADQVPYEPSYRKIYRPKVEYIVKNETYYIYTEKAKLFEYLAKRCIGNKMKVYYSEEDPRKAFVSYDNGALALIIIGILFIIPAVILLLSIPYLY